MALRIGVNVLKGRWARSAYLKLRAWVDRPYQEIEFWPDASRGEFNAEGDAAGRISKRGAWLQIRCADFPGVPDGGAGYFELEDAFD